MDGPFDPACLVAFAERVLTGVDLLPGDASLVARALVEADVDGAATHGLTRLPNYVQRLRAGVMNPRPRMAVVRERGAALLLDGDNGMGQVVAARAMREAIARARRQGVGWVGVRRSGHFGAAAFYCRMALADGMIGIAGSNTPAAMAPAGGRGPFLGTNPLAFAFPAGRRAPVIVDFATSVSARGRVLKAARSGGRIPPGWAVDAEGRPTEDPQAALRGALLPVGGAKGYALALALEVLAAVLTGAAVGPEVPSFFDDMTRESNVGHALVALDVRAFAEPDAFASRMEALVDGLHAVPPAEGSPGVRVPGEGRAAHAARVLREGVRLEPATLEALDRLAAELGVAGLR